MNPVLGWDIVAERCIQDAPEHWLINEDLDLNDADEVIELIQTGSVTTKIGDRSYVVELVIREAM